METKMFMGGNDCLNRKNVCYCFIESRSLIKHLLYHHWKAKMFSKTICIFKSICFNQYNQLNCTHYNLRNMSMNYC